MIINLKLLNNEIQNYSSYWNHFQLSNATKKHIFTYVSTISCYFHFTLYIKNYSFTTYKILPNLMYKFPEVTNLLSLHIFSFTFFFTLYTNDSQHNKISCSSHTYSSNLNNLKLKTVNKN